ncbi:MAG: hypothetical protein K2M61_04710 [Muribaculaceae bacterium]|nr:hypothetical protein [Muribaculaceae bacterium]
MKRTLVLLGSILLATSVWAQRSYELVQDSTFWLTAGNAAALTAMKSRNTSKAEVFYTHSAGDLEGSLQGKKNNIFGADIKSYTRLSHSVVASGNISYTNNSFTDVAGSMLLPTAELMPFDLLETTEDNAGNKRHEQFDVTGAVGWNCFRGLSLGASANFNAGSYAKFKDLRHTNSLMYLDTRAGAFYSLGTQSGVGVSGVYRRRTESVTFETFGTTDKTYTTLIDYANSIGQTETYGSDGFTDAGHELPLFSEFIGFAVQGGYKSTFATATYQHRTGYYGKKSQYTACHSTNEGDFFCATLRYILPENKGYLCMFDLDFSTQLLSTFRTNYIKATLPDNPSVIYYEYFTNTKMSDKAANHTRLKFTGYWCPRGEIYLWLAQAEIGHRWLKQTAYLFPEICTVKTNTITINARARRNFILHNKSLIWGGINVDTQINNYDYISARCEAGYEFALKNPDYRPYLSAGYTYARGLDNSMSHKSRNTIKIAAGITF